MKRILTAVILAMTIAAGAAAAELSEFINAVAAIPGAQKNEITPNMAPVPAAFDMGYVVAVNAGNLPQVQSAQAGIEKYFVKTHPLDDDVTISVYANPADPELGGLVVLVFSYPPALRDTMGAHVWYFVGTPDMVDILLSSL